MTTKTEQVLGMLKGAGFQVYMRKPATDEYCYCTDGTGIAYVQWSDYRTSVSTVHVPNKQTGTGFQFADEITIANVQAAMRCGSPHWASERDRSSVRKYKSWEDFHTKDSWNAGLSQV